MASNAPSDSKSKKKKKSKKKAPSPNPQIPVEDATIDPAVKDDAESEAEVEPEIETELQQDVSPTGDNSHESDPEESDSKPQGTSTETSVDDEPLVAKVTNGLNGIKVTEPIEDDAATRFDALVKDRDTLRNEVSQLRQSLEELQSRHKQEMESMQTELQETQEGKETAEEEYQNLLGKVNTIRSQLGERLKADAEDLAQARTRIEELEEQKAELQEQCTARAAEVEELSTKTQENSKELSTLRNRANLSQQNWVKERDELIEQEAYMREEFESAKQAMHDWEVLAMEERTIRRDLADRNADLEDQLGGLKESYEKAKEERDSQSTTVDGLQKALQEIQTLRKTELKELVESSQTETEGLRKQLQELQSTSDQAKTELDETKKELERALPFEKEVKEKNLLIGKLRHEAVILNDHLTKALRFLKKGKPEDNIDRQIVTNHFLHFLALDRSDPKKFQILQLIAALLGWTDEQREQAGLARPGTGSLRPLNSPSVHRTPSTPALSQQDYFPLGGESITSPGATKESLAELWQNFLEQEASSSAAGGKSRQPSHSTGSGHLR